MKIRDVCLSVFVALIIAVVITVAIQPKVKWHWAGYVRKERAIEIVRYAKSINIMAGWSEAPKTSPQPEGYVVLLIDKNRLQEFWTQYERHKEVICNFWY